jgi:hypothetical protein
MQDSIFIDVLVKEWNRHSINCYVSIHGKFVEIFILCPPSLRKEMESYIFFYFSENKWNKKYPKLVKRLYRDEVIPDYTYSHRYSFEGCRQGEDYLEQWLRKKSHYFRVLEQNRGENRRIWDADGEWRGLAAKHSLYRSAQCCVSH